MMLFLLLLVLSLINFLSCADETSALAYLEEQASSSISEHDLMQKANQDLSIVEKMTYVKDVNETDGTKRYIMFGTRWCGKGNNSDSYDDLGYFEKLDSCCRDHDHCPAQIHEGKKRWGLVNTEDYTISDCQCDDEFHKCLKNINGVVGWVVGNLFFDIISMPCFKIDEDADMDEKEICPEVRYSKPKKAHIRSAATYKKKKGKQMKNQKLKKLHEKKRKRKQNQ